MKVKAAVVQEPAVFFDKKATFKKVYDLTIQSASKGCELIVFPESFVPGYPRGFDFGATIGNRTREGKKMYAKYRQNSVSVDDQEIKDLEELCAQHNIYMVLGITERNDVNGSLYCSMIYLSPHTGFMGVHRKIKPTGTERLVWAEDDGSSLVSFDTAIGKLGGLICWENYMPLARMAMYKKGVQIYIAPTADSRQQWLSTMKHIALEGRCFVLACNQYYTRSMYPKPYRDLLPNEPEEICSGGSVIISPFGEVLQGPLNGEPGVLIAELNMEHIAESKLDFDVIGHYSRDDIFTLNIENQPDMFFDHRSEYHYDKK